MPARLLSGLAVVLALSGHVFTHPRPENTRHTHLHGSLSSRDSTTSEPDDTVSITKMAAVGDSYSAGIGAGNVLSDNDRACSRYDHAYPNLVNQNAWLGDSSTRNFQFKSCSGALVQDVLEKQIPSIDNDQQIILLSAGGNDVQLTNLLNQCVFQWLVLRADTVAEAKVATYADKELGGRAGSIDWDAYGRGCDGQLLYTQSLIEGSHFSESLDNVLSAAKHKLADGGTIYYTGYAKFFGEDLTADCDNVSWSTWVFKLFNRFGSTIYLTKAHRQSMNQLVDAVNAKISAAVSRAGPSVKFIDYDNEVGEQNGRFCEPGVDESIKSSKTRPGLMFYEFNLLDPGGSTPWKRSTNGVYDGTFEGDANYLSEVTQLLDPDAELVVETYVDASTAASSHMRVSAVQSTPAVEKRSLLPDGYGRVFHPQILLHQLIAQRIIYDVVDFVPGSEEYRLEESYFSDSDSDSCTGGDSGDDETGSSEDDDGTEQGQQLALATYIDPGANVGTWERIIALPSSKVSVVVANVVNGPDSSANAGWTDIIPKAAASGKKVIGYVRTGYLGVSQQQFTTRLGSSKTSDWIAQIQEDVDQWYRLYPGHMGGIFFDEAWNDCGADNRNAELYKFITQETKRKYPGAYTVLNPGAPMPQCFEHSADTLLTAEISYATYTSDAYADIDWIPSDPRKIWHIVYDVPLSGVATITKLARSRNVGMLHITDDIEPNPYDSVPNDAYMQASMDAVTGGKPPYEGLNLYTGSTSHVESPLRFQVDQFDYSSATISWLVTSGASGYRIYQDGVLILSLMSWMTVVTVGGLEPNTPYTFSIAAITAGGLSSPRSQPATMQTLALPHKGHTVSSISQSGTGSQTIFKAEILVPYAFVRIFIYEQVHYDYGDHCDWDKKPGWPINYSQYDSMCHHWMIEGGTLYEYTGKQDPITGNSPWVWTWRAEVPFVQSGYDYTWTVPIGISTVDPSKFMLQVQGYGPTANVYNTCPLNVFGDTEGRPEYCL